MRKAILSALAAVAVAHAASAAEAEAPPGLEAVESLLHPQDWVHDKEMRRPAAAMPPRFQEERREAAAAGGADDASGSSFSKGDSGGAASGDVDSASSGAAASSSGGDDDDDASSDSGSASSGEAVIDAAKTTKARGPLGRRTQENVGAVTYGKNGKKMVVPVIAETNSDKPVGVVPPQVTSEKPARVAVDPAAGNPCAQGSDDAACQPQRYSSVPHTVDQLQALPASVAATQHVGEDDKAAADRRAVEDGKYAPHPANFNLENALNHPDRLLSVRPPVPQSNDALVQEARAEVLGKVTSAADREALKALGVDAGAAHDETAQEREAEAERHQQELLKQQRAAEAELASNPAEKAAAGLHRELEEQLTGFERDRRALRMQIGDTRRALAALSEPAGAGVDPHMDLEAGLGSIDDPADPVTGAPAPELRKLTEGQRQRRVESAVESLRAELEQRRAEDKATKGSTAKAEKALSDVAHEAGAAAVRAQGDAERAAERRAHPLAAAAREAQDEAGGKDRESLDAELTGTGAEGRDTMRAAEKGVPGARPRMVDELARLAVKRLETPESDAAQASTLELEMELVALDLKKSLEKVIGKEEKLGERVPGTELAEDEELHRLVTKLADLHHMHKMLSGKAKQGMLAEIANTVVAIKQLFPNPATLAETSAAAGAAAAAQDKSGLPPMPKTHFEPAYVDSLCHQSCHEARQTCQSACQEPQCHSACAETHAKCCPSSLVSVSSTASASETTRHLVRVTPECHARFAQCGEAKQTCAAACEEKKDDACAQKCAETHQECRNPCTVQADEIVRDECGRCHVVHHGDDEKRQECERSTCAAKPVTVATDASGVTKVDPAQPAATDGKETLPAALTEKLLATFLKDQMRFNREVMKQLQEIKEGKASAPAKEALDKAATPAPPAAEEASAEEKPAAKKDAAAAAADDSEEKEEESKAEESAEAHLTNMLRFAEQHLGGKAAAVRTVPVPKVHEHHVTPMPLLKPHAMPAVDHLDSLLESMKEDEA